MATVTVPPDVSPWDAPLTPSYPPALSPGTKRATGRAETGGDSYADAPGPTLAGMWMLKRSEHLKRWNKRWVSLDAAGARLTFRASPGVAKALSHVAVEHIRGASVSSVNFHGNKSYAGRCVRLERKHSDPESDASREVFLVAATSADANGWVTDVRALVAERDPSTREGFDTDDKIRLSPVATPPTPALVAERDPRRAPASASSAASASRSSSSFSSDAGTPADFERSNASRSAFEATSGTAANDADAPSARVASVASLSSARWFDFAKSGTKKTASARARSSAENSERAAEELQATASATHAQMAQVREMAREAREAKDAELRATRESVAGARAAAAEARRRADVTQTRLEEKAAEAASLRRELEDVKAAAALASELARTRLARADALERELGARLAAAEARGDALAEARDAAEAAGTQAADALRADLHAAGVSALRAATEAEASLDAARRRVEALEREKLELERLRGWKGVFARPSQRRCAKKTQQTNEGFSFSVENFENFETTRNDAPLLADAPPASEVFAARVSPSSSSAPRGYRGNGVGSARSGGGFVAAATAASAPAEASTPEAAATARRRLFEYGLVAPPTPADILQTLDSPGAHGCRQM